MTGRLCPTGTPPNRIRGLLAFGRTSAYADGRVFTPKGIVHGGGRPAESQSGANRERFAGRAIRPISRLCPTGTPPKRFAIRGRFAWPSAGRHAPYALLRECYATYADGRVFMPRCIVHMDGSASMPKGIVHGGGRPAESHCGANSIRRHPTSYLYLLLARPPRWPIILVSGRAVAAGSQHLCRTTMTVGRNPAGR